MSYGYYVQSKIFSLCSIIINIKITCKFGGQWSNNSNMCLMFWASWITKFNSMSNSPPTSWKEKLIHTQCSKIQYAPIRKGKFTMMKCDAIILEFTTTFQFLIHSIHQQIFSIRVPVQCASKLMLGTWALKFSNIQFSNFLN